MNQTGNIKLMDDVMITVHDKDFNITHANAAAKKTLKLPELENAKIKCYEYYHKQDISPQNCPVFKSVITGMPQTVRVFGPNIRKNMLIRIIPLFDDNDDFVGAVHFASDVSDVMLTVDGGENQG